MCPHRYPTYLPKVVVDSIVDKMDVPTQATYQLVFHKSYEEIKDYLDGLKSICQWILICQHNKDEDVKTTHCHIAVKCIKTQAKTTKSACETLRDKLPKEIKGQGQFFVSDRTTKTREIYEWDILCRYILKGDEGLMMWKTDNITDEMIAEWRSAFVEAKKELLEKLPKLKEKQKEYTQWDVIEQVRNEGTKHEQLTNKGYYIITVKPSKENYDLLLDKLDKYRIRTSMNELERIWLTVIREDPSVRQATYEKFQSKFLNY